MKVFKNFVVLALIATIILSVYIAIQPSRFKISKTKIINAPVATVYNTVANYNNWTSWFIWYKNANNSKAKGKDKTPSQEEYNWQDTHGVGTISTLKTYPNTSIEQDVVYSGFSNSKANWTFVALTDTKTQITWDIEVSNLTFKFKVFHLFFGNIELEVESHLKHSLEQLNALIRENINHYTVDVKGITTRSGTFYVYDSVTCKTPKLTKVVQTKIPQLYAYLKAKKISASGAPFIYYHKWDATKNEVKFSCCLPTADRVEPVQYSKISSAKLEAFKGVKTILNGNYSYLKEAWDASIEHINTTNLEIDTGGPMLEIYTKSSLEHVTPADWITELYIAVK